MNTVEKPPRLRRIITMTVNVETYGNTEPQFAIVDEVRSVLERELRAGKVLLVSFRGETGGYE